MKETNEIRVLYVTHYNELYGANLSLLQMILELRRKGVNPTVLLPPGKEQPGNNLRLELIKNGIPYVETPIRFDKHRVWFKLLANYLFAVLLRLKAYQEVKDMEFDIVHSNSSTISLGAYIAKKLNKRHIWHLRELGNSHYGLKTPFGKWFQHIIYGGDNTFIAVSRKVFEYYSKFIGKQKMEVIYNGIKPFTEVIHHDDALVQICIVGLLEKGKGQMELLKATHELITNRNIRNFHINIIGSGYQPYIDELIDYITNHDLSGYVTMFGRRNDVPEFLAKMDVGVMASLDEAFGRVTVEYMMAGVAAVVSDSGANTEIVEEGKTGLIYKKGNIKSLADKLSILINNTEFRHKLASNGRIEAIKKFSSNVNSDAVYRLYNKVLQRS